MIANNTETPAIDQIIDRAAEQNPHATELLKALGPIIERQRQLAADSLLAAIDFSSVSKEKLKAGVPVIRQVHFLTEAEDLKKITLTLAKAVIEGMPNLSEGMERFCDLVEKGKIVPADYFKTSTEDSKSPVENWNKDLKVSPSNASLLMSLVGRVVLEQRAKEATAELGEFAWEKGFCPICGEFPSIALIEEQGGKRFLHCSSCGNDWRFTRVVCPYCEKEASKEMDYFYIADKTQESAFVCDDCKKYLVTLYRAGNLLARDMDISAISLVHLDMIMQDKGYEPMTACPWNILK
jgi:FdhE protein